MLASGQICVKRDDDERLQSDTVAPLLLLLCEVPRHYGVVLLELANILINLGYYVLCVSEPRHWDTSNLQGHRPATIILSFFVAPFINGQRDSRPTLERRPCLGCR